MVIDENSKIPSELAIAEIGEIHQYCRAIFSFDTNWNTIIWTANAVAVGWLVAANPNYLEEFAVCLVFVFVNGIAVYSLKLSRERYNVFVTRLCDLIKMVGHSFVGLKPALAVEQVQNILEAIRRVTIVLIVAWSIVGIYKLLLHLQILGPEWAI